MKVTKISTIAAILSLAAVGSAFAAAGSTTSFSDTTSTVGTPAITVKVSKNVTVVYKASTAVSGNGSVGYGITSAHSSGSKSFGSSSGDTKIFMMDTTANPGMAAPEAAGASAGFGAGWTAM